MVGYFKGYKVYLEKEYTFIVPLHLRYFLTCFLICVQPAY